MNIIGDIIYKNEMTLLYIISNKVYLFSIIIVFK